MTHRRHQPRPQAPWLAGRTGRRPRPARRARPGRARGSLDGAEGAGLPAAALCGGGRVEDTEEGTSGAMLVLLACSVGGEKGAEKGKGKDKAAESVWAVAGVRERIGGGGGSLLFAYV